MASVPDAASSISVAIRVRPFTVREAAQILPTAEGPLFLGEGSLAAGHQTPVPKSKGIKSVLKVIDDKCLVFDPPDEAPAPRGRFGGSGKRSKDQTFGFDRVFDENATQGDVYEATTRNLLDSVLDGFNATVFAYGATGCGKTHTITGTIQAPGVIFLTMQELFERIADRTDEKVTEISLSYLEIYNETIRDLLEPVKHSGKQGLMLREDANQAVSVAGLSSHRPQNVQEVMDMIVRGNEHRTMSPTEANATSSRSHAVLQINVTQKDRNADINEPHTMATLSIIDLAGSERASATKNRGERLLEGANINKSLLALGSCINALCDPKKRNHVPYRNSKLTRLLKFSLGGNCKTVMIVCISPSSQHFDETQNTLRYANRAKNIQTKVTRNVYNVNRHVKDFVIKIDEQMALIKELQQQLKDHESVAFAKFDRSMQKRRTIMHEGMARLQKAYDDSKKERDEKNDCLQKLRQIDQRIRMVRAWLGAFEHVSENAEEDETSSLQACGAKLNQTASSLLSDLGNTREHYQRRLDKNHWERAMQSALQNAVRQLQDCDSLKDSAETICLDQKFELLQQCAEREQALIAINDDRTGETGLVQILLQAHFQAMTTTTKLANMSTEDALRHGKLLLQKVVKACTAVISHVIVPNSELQPIRAFPPMKQGTPKRERAIMLTGASPFKSENGSTLFPVNPYPNLSPARASPRRRKAPVKRGVTLTPKKRSPRKGGTKRAVRWKDDIEQGVLAEFEKTPNKAHCTTQDTVSVSDSMPVAVSPSPRNSLRKHLSTPNLQQVSPKPTPPKLLTEQRGKTNRFQAGFLAKKNDGSSPKPPVLTHLSSDSEHSPLRELHPGTAGNRSALRQSQNADDISPVESGASATTTSTSDSEDLRIWHTTPSDAMQIRKAVKRASMVAAPTSASLSRQRRRSPASSHRGAGSTSRASASPPGNENMFTASQARRMVKSSERDHRDADSRLSSSNGVLSPRSAALVKKHMGHRRTTLSAELRSREAGSASRVTSGTSGGTASGSRGSLAPSGKGMWR